MKAWFRNFLLLFWPWREIDELEKALAAKEALLKASHDRYNNAYRDGFTHHLQQWMAQANQYYGKEPFTDAQKTLMVDLYNRGYDRKEALEMLYRAEARGDHKQWHTMI